MQLRTHRLCHPSPPPKSKACRRPTNTAARPPPPSFPNNATVQALRRRHPPNAVACPPLSKLIVVCARLPPSCHCHPACTESIILSAHHAEGIYDTLSAVWCYYANSGGNKKTTTGNTDNRLSKNLVNSALMARPIGLPPEGAKVCHTSNILLVGPRCRCAQSQL